MKKLSGFLLLFVFLCCSLSAKETQIIIFSTNDMHGSIDNFAKIASYIQKERAKNPNILILSGGDMFSGNPVVDQYPEKGFPMIDLMNRIGYQYEIFGNHEFDYGQEVLNRRMEQANFQFLCANMIVDEETAGIKYSDRCRVIVLVSRTHSFYVRYRYDLRRQTYFCKRR